MRDREHLSGIAHRLSKKHTLSGSQFELLRRRFLTGGTVDCNGDKFSRALIRSGGCRTNRPSGIEGGTAVFGTPIFGERRGKWIVGTSVKKVPAGVPANTVLKGLKRVKKNSGGGMLDSKRKRFIISMSAMP